MQTLVAWTKDAVGECWISIASRRGNSRKESTLTRELWQSC